jgi:hypothetical protein
VSVLAVRFGALIVVLSGWKRPVANLVGFIVLAGCPPQIREGIVRSVAIPMSALPIPFGTRPDERLKHEAMNETMIVPPDGDG